ncbi:MAG: hypothetical protein CEE43_08870 [Promethearchaeota archaeon Loki_b32]|nr:MAG: hypothetical protein CEE43_08870 [Candidatus Lokiarchaeota archaeon Loki_b32]
MSETLEFRRINEIEEKIIITSLTKISSDFQQIINNFKKFLYFSTESLTSRSIFPNIFLISKDQYTLLQSLKSDRIISAGLYFGFIKKGNFHISLEGAEFLYKNNKLSSFRRIYVNDKGEKSILYGNNILKNMIIKFPISLRKKDLLLVINKYEEVLALIRSKFDYQDIQEVKPKDIIAINLIDKGIYLRVSQ